MKAIKWLNRYWAFLLLYGIFLVIALFPFYQDGFLILGGEGNYWLDFSAHLKNYFFAWQNKGTGDFNISLNTSFPNVIFFALLQRIIDNQQIINFILVFLLYFLPFLGMLILCREFKINSFIAFLASIFYVVNPFSLMFLYCLNQWNALVLFSLPLFFWVILRFYHDILKLFFYFGLTSLLLSFTNVNPPLVAINLISVAIAVLITAFYLDEKANLIELFKKYFLLALSFILFNAWWLANWLYILVDVQRLYTKQFAISWLRGAGEFVPVLFRTFNLTMLLPNVIEREYNFFTYYYASPFMPFFLSIPIFILIYAFLRKKLYKRYLIFLSSFLFIVAFLVKGIQGVFGSFYEFAIMNVPFFSIFKSATEKWGVLYIFLFALLLAIILKELKKDRHGKLILFVFLAYLAICLVPFIKGKFISDYQFNENIIGTRKFFDKKEYQILRKELNQDPSTYRVLSFPGSANYQIALHVEENRFYTGLDPVLNNTNVPFIAPYSYVSYPEGGLLFNSISKPNYLNLMGLYNIKKVVINKDVYPWFGFLEEENSSEIEAILDKNLESTKNEVISLYQTGDYYSPRYYVPEKIIYGFTTEAKNFDSVVSAAKDLPKKSAFFFAGPNEKNDLVQENSSEITVVGENRSVIDEVYLRAGVRGLNPEGVLFPYARWKPGSFVYPIIEKKEEKVKKQLADDRWALAEQNLFFAAKRIYEIQKWEKELDDDQYKQVLENHKKEMLAAVGNLEELTEEEVDTFILLAKIEVSFEAYQKRLFDVLLGNYGTPDNDRGRLAQGYIAMIDARLKEIVERYFFYPKYYFEIPEDGEYEILMGNMGVSPEWQIERVLQGDKKQNIGGPQPFSKEDTWISFGREQFSQGGAFLEMVKPTPENLLSEDMTSEGSFSQEIRDLKPETIYRLSFDYKTQDGKMKLLVLEERGERLDSKWQEVGLGEEEKKTIDVLDRELDSHGKWQSFQVSIKTGRRTRSLTIIFSKIPEENKDSQMEYKNAKLEAIFEPKIVLKKVKRNQPFPAPQIIFQKINPTKYIVDVEGAVDSYFLIFSESFHRGWQVYITKPENSHQSREIVGSYFDGEIKEIKAKEEFFDRRFFQTLVKKPLSDEKHFILNGYANSWYITPEDSGGEENYQVIIEYWPQRLYYLGLIVTILTIVFTLGIGFYRKFLLSKD